MELEFQSPWELVWVLEQSWQEFQGLWQHSKGLRKMNSTRPWKPFQGMFQVLGWCSEASGTCLDLGIFSGKSSDAYGSIPKPWVD